MIRNLKDQFFEKFNITLINEQFNFIPSSIDIESLDPQNAPKGTIDELETALQDIEKFMRNAQPLFCLDIKTIAKDDYKLLQQIEVTQRNKDA